MIGCCCEDALHWVTELYLNMFTSVILEVHLTYVPTPWQANWEGVEVGFRLKQELITWYIKKTPSPLPDLSAGLLLGVDLVELHSEMTGDWSQGLPGTLRIASSRPHPFTAPVICHLSYNRKLADVWSVSPQISTTVDSYCKGMAALPTCSYSQQFPEIFWWTVEILLA